jgi:outer membrane protein assembly factor BamB
MTTRKLTAAVLTLVVSATLAADTAPSREEQLLTVGTLSARWQRPISQLGWVAGLDAGSHTLVFTTSETPDRWATAVDTRTGATRWRSLLDAAWSVERGALVMAAPGVALAGESNGSYLLGVGLDDGRVRWRTPVGDGASATTGTARVHAGMVFTATAQILVARRGHDGIALWQQPLPEGCGDYLTIGGTPPMVVVACETAVLAWDPANGRTGWTWQASAGCRVRELAASIHVLGLLQTCGDEVQLVLLDPGDGTAMWHRRAPGQLPEDRNHALYIDADLIAVATGTLSAFNRAGDTLLRHDDVTCTQDCLTVRDDAAYLTYYSDTELVLEAVDVDTGAARWQHFLATDSVQLGPTHAYTGIYLDVDPLDLGAIAVVDLQSGEQFTTAALLPSAGVVAADRSTAYLSYWTRDGEEWLAAARPPSQPDGFLAGAPANQWPGACELLTLTDLRTILPGVTYTPVPEHLTIAGETLPNPQRCLLAPNPRTAPQITVSVSWMGKDADQARALLPEIPANGIVPGLGDLALRPQQTNLNDAVHTSITVLTGATIITIEMIGDSTAIVPLARTAVQTIAAHHSRE